MLLLPLNKRKQHYDRQVVPIRVFIHRTNDFTYGQHCLYLWTTLLVLIDNTAYTFEHKKMKREIDLKQYYISYK